MSKEFCYSPAYNQTDVDLSFINGWLFEHLKDASAEDGEDFSGLYLDDNDRRILDSK